MDMRTGPQLCIEHAPACTSDLQPLMMDAASLRAFIFAWLQQRPGLQQLHSLLSVAVRFYKPCTSTPLHCVPASQAPGCCCTQSRLVHGGAAYRPRQTPEELTLLQQGRQMLARWQPDLICVMCMCMCRHASCVPWWGVCLPLPLPQGFDCS